MKGVAHIPVLENIPVLLRTSLNAPVVDGKVENTFRLESALPTIRFLKERHARVILISHITGTGAETFHPMYEVVKHWLPNLVWCPVHTGVLVRDAIRALPPGGVIMLENLRRSKGEEKNDPEFAKELASLADVFVQDSFDVCHREHASVVGVPGLLPSYAGLTVAEEVKQLEKALKPRHPSLAIIAGAKFQTKEPVLKKLLATYDHVFVGGALANDLLKAKGYPVGVSLVSNEGQQEIAEYAKHKRLVLQVDSVVAKKGEDRSKGRAASLQDVASDEMIFDVGPHTVSALTDLVNKAKTVLWNGPLGLYEHGFTDGTHALAKAIAGSSAHSIVGGGDTIAAIDELSLSGHFSFISTGGGAMLDYLAYGTLPGLRVLR